MSESPADSEHAFTNMLTVFSVSAGMIGACLTAIGLGKIVSQAKGLRRFCDDLIVIDAMIFGVAALLGFQGLRRFIRHRTSPPHQLMDWIFLIGLGLMIVICGVFAWSLL